MRVTVLGSGSSGGVPLIGNIWGNCDPTNPKNRRRRVSVLVEVAGKTILIDASPDMREQLLDAEVTHLDAILFTHDHADHCHGLDDVRPLAWSQGPIETWASPRTLAELRQKFSYAFPSADGQRDSLYPPLLDEHEIAGPFEAAGIPVTPFEQAHGKTTSLGFRIGNFAYSTDLKALDDQAFAVLDGVDLWILDCVRDAPHPTHTHVAQAFEWAGRVQPKRTVLTHMNHTLDYDELLSRCPPGVEPGYDGLVIDL